MLPNHHRPGRTILIARMSCRQRRDLDHLRDRILGWSEEDPEAATTDEQRDLSGEGHDVIIFPVPLRPSREDCRGPTRVQSRESGWSSYAGRSTERKRRS